MTALVPLTPANLDGPERQSALVAQAREWLTEARDVVAVNSLRSQAAAIETYGRTIRESAQAVTAATEIRLRAERRIGELLAEQEMPKGGRPRLLENRSTPVTGFSPLTAHGLTKYESSNFQRLAAVPSEEFEEAVEQAKEVGKLSRSGVIRAVQAEAPPSNAAVWIDANRFMKACQRVTEMRDVAVAAVRFGLYPGDWPALVTNSIADELAAAADAIAQVQTELRRATK